MGFFSTKKTVHVSSVVYNMSGDFDPKKTFTKSLILSTILQSKDIGNAIVDSFTSGPAATKKQFYNWATSHNYRGNITTLISKQAAVDIAVIQNYISVPSGQIAYVNKAFVDKGDIAYFADEWLLNNNPTQRFTSWVVNLTAPLEMTITYENTSTDVVSLPSDFSTDNDYLYYYYSIYLDTYSDPLVEGAIIVSDNLPDTSNYTITLSETNHIKKERITYLSNSGTNETTSYRTDFYEQWYDGSHYSYQESYQITYSNTKLSDNIGIYLIGSGITELDNIIEDTNDISTEFYPIIPLRINNQSVKDVSDDTVYPEITRAYEKMSGSTFTKLLSEIDNNPDKNNIDYAYLHLGISLNAQGQKDKKYIYKFLKGLIPYQNYDRSVYEDWLANQKLNFDYKIIYAQWVAAQSDPSSVLYNTPKPINNGDQGLNIATPSITKLKLHTNNSFNDNFNVTIQWFNIEESLGSGLGKPNAYVGEYWFEYPDNGVGNYESWWYSYLLGASDPDTANSLSLDRLDVYMFHQVDENTYTKLSITGLEYLNFVYKKISVQTTAWEALKSSDPSEFIIPLHSPTLRLLSISDRNDVISNSHQLIFNCYKIVKTRWYQSKVFAVIVTVALIAITIATAGTSSPYTVTSLVSASINAVVYTASLYDIDISWVKLNPAQYLLERTFDLFFDKKIAQLISVIVIATITQDFSKSLDVILTDLITNVDLVMKITTSVVDIVYDNSELIEEVKLLQEQYELLTKQIEDNNLKLGLTKTSSNDIGSLMITNALLNLKETPDQFINRTTANSSDIINASLQYITNYTNIMLDLDVLKKGA